MERVIYIGDGEHVGHTALMRNDGKVQVDRTDHKWSHGWHAVEDNEWQNLDEFFAMLTSCRDIVKEAEALLETAIDAATSRSVKEMLKCGRS